MEVEYGSSSPVKFPDHSCYKLTDSSGDEVKVPTCEKCGNYKSPVMGKYSFAWLCLTCDNTTYLEV